MRFLSQIAAKWRNKLANINRLGCGIIDFIKISGRFPYALKWENLILGKSVL